MKFLQVALLFTFLMLVVNVAVSVSGTIVPEGYVLRRYVPVQYRRDDGGRDRTMDGRLRWG